MKKTILTTTLALGLGVSGLTAADNAEASEHNINKQELAEMAQSHSSELDNAPLHEGEYHYNFNLNNVDYDFKSDGVNYTWAYGSNGAAQTETAEQHAPQVTEAPVQEQSAPQVTEAPVQEQSAPQVTEAPAQEEQPAQETVEAVQEAPQVEEVQEAPEQNVQQTEEDSQPAAPASTSSTKEQFLQAGGTEAMWQNIVMPESSGNPNAVNELGYRGLGQTKESWGTGSVAEQTAGMINYAEERYGSVEAAMEFRNANNWW